MPDGSMPIPDEAHLHAAFRLIDNHSNPEAALAHAIGRAKTMGLEAAIPPAYRVAPEGGDQTGKGQPASTAKPDDTASAAKAETVTKGFEEISLDGEMAYAFVKASEEERYTLGPLYMPERLDAHEEWTSAEDLRKAAIDYVRETGGDRTIFLQHSPVPAGEWVAIMQWPHEVHATMTKSVDGVMKSVGVTFPADTVYLGVIWEPWAWEEVKKGKIAGYSMGGWAHRLTGAPASA